jgi:hypothetical protein
LNRDRQIRLSDIIRMVLTGLGAAATLVAAMALSFYLVSAFAMQSAAVKGFHDLRGDKIWLLYLLASGIGVLLAGRSQSLRSLTDAFLRLLNLASYAVLTMCGYGALLAGVHYGLHPKAHAPSPWFVMVFHGLMQSHAWRLIVVGTAFAICYLIEEYYLKRKPLPQVKMIDPPLFLICWLMYPDRNDECFSIGPFWSFARAEEWRTTVTDDLEQLNQDRTTQGQEPIEWKFSSTLELEADEIPRYVPRAEQFVGHVKAQLQSA